MLYPLHNKLIYSQNKLSKQPELAYEMSLDMKQFEQKWISHGQLTHSLSYSFSYSDTIQHSVTSDHIRSNFSYIPLSSPLSCIDPFKMNKIISILPLYKVNDLLFDDENMCNIPFG